MKITIYVVLMVLSVALLGAAAQDGDSLKAAEITPEALAKTLQSDDRSNLLILNVGPRLLFAQAHIRGAEYVGPASDPHGLELLRNRLRSVVKNKRIVLYCGCCPWERCPNIRPAYAELRKLAFTNVQVLYIPNNIGTDWVDKGYPTTKGE